MGIDTAVTHVDREIRTAKAALEKAKAANTRAQAVAARAAAVVQVCTAEVDRLTAARKLLTGETAVAPRRRGAPPGENARRYAQYVEELERMPEGTTRAEVRHALGMAFDTERRYLARAVREGRVIVTDRLREKSPVLERPSGGVVDISMRRSA